MKFKVIEELKTKGKDFLNADIRRCNTDIRRFTEDNLRESAFDLRKSALNKKYSIIFAEISKCLMLNLLFLLIIAFIILAGCQRKERTKSEELQAIPVKVIRVQLKDIPETLDYAGNIKAEDEAAVYPKVSGKIIQKLKEDGDEVNKGETIAYIDRDEVGLKFEKSPVESPLDGVIGRVYVDIGENVIAQTPIALVVKMDKVKVNLDIPEKYTPKISLGQSALIGVDAWPEEKFAGEVSKISPVVDLETRTAPVEIAIDNPGYRLKSGMFARVKLIIQEGKNVPVILKEAIMGREPDLYVYVIENKKASLKKITLGIRQGPYFEVKDGLKEGDLAVIMGQQKLYDGALVELRE